MAQPPAAPLKKRWLVNNLNLQRLPGAQICRQLQALSAALWIVLGKGRLLEVVDAWGSRSSAKCSIKRYWGYWNSGLAFKAFLVAPGRTNLLSTNLN
jgi:hypothetical protein